MKTFSYKAYDSQAVRIDGEIEANDLQSARLALSRKGLMIASLQEKRVLSLELSYFLAPVLALMN